MEANVICLSALANLSNRGSPMEALRRHSRAMHTYRSGRLPLKDENFL